MYLCNKISGPVFLPIPNKYARETIPNSLCHPLCLSLILITSFHALNTNLHLVDSPIPLINILSEN